MEALKTIAFYKKLGAIILCALIMSLPAFLNGYPFLFQDSWDYLSGFAKIYRLPVYGTFTQLGVVFGTPWAIALAQGFIIAHLMYYVNKSVFGKTNLWFLIAQTAFLTVFSSLPFFSAFMMADVFTPILFMALYLLAFHSDIIPLPIKIYFWGLAVFAAMAHITNIYLGLGILIFAAMVKFIRADFSIKALKPLAVPMVIMVTAIGWVMSLNAYYFRTFSLSPASPVFALANLVSQGSARRYILDVCPQAQLKICKFAKALPSDVNDFLWHKGGVVPEFKGFKNFAPEAKYIVKQTIVNYPGEVIMNSAEYFTASFGVHAPAVELNSSLIKDRVYNALTRNYGKQERDAYLRSKQANDALPYDLIRAIDDVSYPLSLGLLVLMSLFFLRRINDNRVLLPLFTLVYILGNNFLCAAASGLFDRYQARVSWLMVFAVVLMAGYLFKQARDGELNFALNDAQKSPAV